MCPRIDFESVWHACIWWFTDMNSLICLPPALHSCRNKHGIIVLIVDQDGSDCFVVCLVGWGLDFAGTQSELSGLRLLWWWIWKVWSIHTLLILFNVLTVKVAEIKGGNVWFLCISIISIKDMDNLFSDFFYIDLNFQDSLLNFMYLCVSLTK